MYDVLIVGGGAAGIRAAIAAAGTDPRLRIAMVSKVYPMRSHTVSAEGGAAAVLREDDSLDGHAFDTIKGSDYLADQDVVEYFVQQAPLEINQLERWGCPWSREPDGSISVRPFGGMTTWRTCFAADKTGFHMLHALFQTSLRYTQVVRHDESFVTSLLVEDGRCLGVTAMDARTGTVEALRARAVILATGGAGRIYSFTTNAAICTGDGMALAYRAGAPLKDMEFVQFHPTGLPHTGILITEAVRGEGGYLLNKEGERFLERYVPTRMELGPGTSSPAPSSPSSRPGGATRAPTATTSTWTSATWGSAPSTRSSPSPASWRVTTSGSTRSRRPSRCAPWCTT